MAALAAREEEELMVALAVSASEQGGAGARPAAAAPERGLRRAPSPGSAEEEAEQLALALALSRSDAGLLLTTREGEGEGEPRWRPAPAPAPTQAPGPDQPPAAAPRPAVGRPAGADDPPPGFAFPAPEGLLSSEVLGIPVPQGAGDASGAWAPGRDPLGSSPGPQQPSPTRAAPTARASPAPRPQGGGRGLFRGAFQPPRCKLCEGLVRGGMVVEALGSTWHPECFRCAGCGQRLPPGSSFACRDGEAYHPECCERLFLPECRVCGRQGLRRYLEDPFWRDIACPEHADDGTRRCKACTRLPRREAPHVELPDGSCLCVECSQTVVVDSRDAQPLYDEILTWYARLGMGLPQRPPLLLVGPEALEERPGTAPGVGAHQGAQGLPSVLGLTLCETRLICEAVDGRGWGEGLGGRGGSGLRGLRDMLLRPSMQVREVACSLASHEVAAILVLHGLPRLLAGSVLAHECLHAHLRMAGVVGLRLEVEEGLAQLMAYLWLADQHTEGERDRLHKGFHLNRIHEHPDPAYGGGFRAAFEAYERLGSLQDVLNHVKLSGSLPIV